MDLTYLSIISFILITLVYYAVPSIGKMAATLKIFTNAEEMDIFNRESNIRLAIYLAVVLLSQFIINTTFVINACGGSSASNYGSAFLITFLPWIFIFGVMLIALIMYPGFKGAFSDVVGYFFVSDKANTLLSQILMSDTTAQTAINGIADATVKSDLTRAAESIIKLVGNKAILINQITPLNFISTWDTLKQLMKPTMYENEQLKSELLDLAVMRENVGEALWYIYTGLLIISYTSYKITSASCPPDMNQVIKKKVVKTADKVSSTATNVGNKVSSKATNVVAPAAVETSKKMEDKAKNVGNKASKIAKNEVAPRAVNVGNRASNIATNEVAPIATNTVAPRATNVGNRASNIATNKVGPRAVNSANAFASNASNV